MFLNQLPLFLKKDMFRQFSNDLMVGNAEGFGPMSWHYGAKTMCITFSSPE